jgi:hypothetical protein
LYESAVTLDAKKAILPDLLYAYLRLPKVDLAAKLVENCLLRQDLDPNDAVARSLDDYLAKPPAGADPNVLLDALTKIKAPEARPLWRDRLREWITRFGKARAPGRLEPGGVSAVAVFVVRVGCAARASEWGKDKTLFTQKRAKLKFFRFFCFLRFFVFAVLWPFV